VRPNSLKAKLRAGQRAVGALITVNSPELVETFGHLDYQALLVVTGPLIVDAARSLLQALRG
jgi:hypothetical protein